MTHPTEIQVDVQEHGANQQTLNQRLYMQLQVFGDCHDAHVLAHALRASGIEGVLYRDLNDPMGVGILAMHQDPLSSSPRCGICSVQIPSGSSARSMI